MSNNHRTKRIHIDKNGVKQPVYTSGKYHEDYHLKDGTPLKATQTTNFRNIKTDSNGKSKVQMKHSITSNTNRNPNHIGTDIPDSDEWSDYAQTESDF